MCTLPKHSGTSEGSKFTSVVHSEPEPEVSKVPLNEGKAMEVVSSGADGSSDDFKATKTETQMENPDCQEKEITL